MPRGLEATLESCEHIAVGNAIELAGADGKRTKAGACPLPVGGRSLTYGQLVALGGDFYGVGARPGSPGHPPLEALDPISSAQNPKQAFASAFQTLVDAPKEELKQILAVMDEEQRAIDEARKAGLQPSAAYAKLGDSLSYKWSEITGGAPASWGRAGVVLYPGRYIDLATVNMDHFGTDAVKAYLAGHGYALEQAAALHGQDPSSPAVASKLLACYAMNAFADHFLTDLFAAGHVRTPRRALWEIPQTVAGETGLLTRAAHNEDNHDGLHFSNARGEKWTAYGDGKELDEVNAQNLALAIAAVQASAHEVFAAYDSGVATVPSPAAALQYIPKLDFSAKPAPGGPDHAPLFWADPHNVVYRRGGNDGAWGDKTSYDYVTGFSVIKMAAQISDLIGGGSTTNLACYLRKGDDVTWYWGLNNDDSYYQVNGFWITTPHTKLQKFVTQAGQDDLLAAAANALRYNKLDGYSVVGVFAADKSVGYNYPIISGESTLYPLG